MLNNRVALITGSSNGIGKEIAKQLMVKGYWVILNGRRPHSLELAKEELLAYGEHVHAISCDITDEAAVKNMVDEINEKYGRLDVLVCNAGLTLRSKLAETQPHVFNKIFETNVFGSVCTVIHALDMIKRNKGSIVFMSSSAGIRGLPEFSAYCAAKMSLRAIADSLRIEEYKSGIHVGLIYVGFTENEDSKVTLKGDGSTAPVNNNTGFKVMSREQVASAIIQNIEKRKFITVLTGLGKLNAFMNRFFPKTAEWIIRKKTAKHL